jgi:uncharacterized membrane protein YbhN (UPF0104 family)
MRRGPSSAAPVLGALLLLALAALLVKAVLSAPPGVLTFLRRARSGPLVAGLLVYALGFFARGLRLNLLLAEEDRIPLGRAWSVSAAGTFLLQVVPFRGGELAAWAVLKRAVGLGWARSGAVFALVKTIDSACLVLVGLAGAASLAARAGKSALSIGSIAALLAVALGLLSAPWPGASVARAFARRAPDGGRLARLASEIAAGLDVAARRPGLYALGLALALMFLGAHVAALSLLLSAFGVSVPVAALAFASMTSTFLSSLVPSPAGTFGPMESGFAAGLAAAGVPLAPGVAYGALLHLVTTAVTGVLAIPLLKSARA